MNSKPALVKILTTDSLTDIAQIKSVLDSKGMRYFLQGENMKTIRPVDPVILMVEGKDEKKVLELLRPLKLRYLQFSR
jgi:hypothetical protein